MELAERPVLNRTTIANIHGWLDSARADGAIALIDKEENWTSFDCVAKLRNATRIKKVGHAGTLDPLATGLLVLCFGRATKDIEKLQDDTKVYEVTIRMGATSTTDDRAGDITAIEHTTPSDEAIHAALRAFVGTIEQIPPSYSAIRHSGRRQYDLAREGKDFTPKPRVVTVHSITNVVVKWPLVRCTIECSKGTYIRSIARDVGAALGCGGYVEQLRRTASGGFAAMSALRVAEIAESIAAEATA